jgi:hypothetical protein
MSTTKSTNPKDTVGATKLPLDIVPATATALAALAHLDGALKYGKWNWRESGVRSSIYVAAALRHIQKWNNGEELDPDSGVHHLGHVLACINILIDALAMGNLNDDRPPSADLGPFMAALTKDVERLKQLHADKNPYHYSIKDTK